MSISNNNIVPTVPKTSNSLSVYIPAPAAVAGYFLSKLSQIYDKIRNLDSEQLRTVFEANMTAAKAAANAAKSEAEKDANAAIWNAIGGMAEGVFSIGAACYMMKNTAEMKAIQGKIKNAEGWKQSLDKSGKIGVLKDNVFASKDSYYTLGGQGGKERMPFSNVAKNRRLKNTKEILNLSENKVLTTKEAETRLARHNEKLNDQYKVLKDEHARNSDFFGTEELHNHPQEMPNHSYGDILGSADREETREIEKNITKYISEKQKALGDLANGGKRNLQSQVIQGVGKTLTGAFGIAAGNELLKKRQNIYDKNMNQTYMEMTKTAINQLIQNMNSITQQQLNIFGQTLLALGAVGIMPS